MDEFNYKEVITEALYSINNEIDASNDAAADYKQGLLEALKILKTKITTLCKDAELIHSVGGWTDEELMNLSDEELIAIQKK